MCHCMQKLILSYYSRTGPRRNDRRMGLPRQFYAYARVRYLNDRARMPARYILYKTRRSEKLKVLYCVNMIYNIITTNDKYYIQNDLNQIKLKVLNRSKMKYNIITANNN